MPQQVLDDVRRHARDHQPARERVPQVMYPKILDACPTTSSKKSLLDCREPNSGSYRKNPPSIARIAAHPFTLRPQHHNRLIIQRDNARLTGLRVFGFQNQHPPSEIDARPLQLQQFVLTAARMEGQSNKRNQMRTPRKSTAAPLVEVAKKLDAGGHRSVWDRALGNLRAADIAAGVVIGTTGVVASVAPQKAQAAEHEVVRPAGIEPATPAFGGQYSIH